MTQAFRSYGTLTAEQIAEGRALLERSSGGRWIENGTLVGVGIEECDASTDEEETDNWITFKTPRPDADRALWIWLRNNAEALLDAAAHKGNNAE